MSEKRWACLVMASKRPFILRARWGESTVRALARMGYLTRYEKEPRGKWCITTNGLRRLHERIATHAERQLRRGNRHTMPWADVAGVGS